MSRLPPPSLSPTAAINAPAAISAQSFETLKSGEVARSVLEIGVE